MRISRRFARVGHVGGWYGLSYCTVKIYQMVETCPVGSAGLLWTILVSGFFCSESFSSMSCGLIWTWQER